VAEKRRYRRFEIWFPLTICFGKSEVWAICRDASAGGVLVAAVSGIPTGTAVTLRFRVVPGALRERVLRASVLREFLTDDDLVLAFPHQIALEFEKAAPEIIDDMYRHAETLKP
jgi:hypothetical protein